MRLINYIIIKYINAIEPICGIIEEEEFVIDTNGYARKLELTGKWEKMRKGNTQENEKNMQSICGHLGYSNFKEQDEEDEQSNLRLTCTSDSCTSEQTLTIDEFGFQSKCEANRIMCEGATEKELCNVLSGCLWNKANLCIKPVPRGSLVFPIHWVLGTFFGTGAVVAGVYYSVNYIILKEQKKKEKTYFPQPRTPKPRKKHRKSSVKHRKKNHRYGAQRTSKARTTNQDPKKENYVNGKKKTDTKNLKAEQGWVGWLYSFR